MQALIVDDHPLIHEVMQAVLVRALGPEAIYSEAALDPALSRAQELDRLGLVVLDLGLPGCSRLEALQQFRARFPNLPIVVLSATEEAEVMRAAIAAGANGYIPKTSSVDVMEAALRLVRAGGTYVPERALCDDAAQGGGKRASSEGLSLSERQLEVLRLIAKGLSNQKIAARLEISESTVKHHVHDLFRALGVSTRTEALVAAMRRGLIVE